MTINMKQNSKKKNEQMKGECMEKGNQTGENKVRNTSVILPKDERFNRITEALHLLVSVLIACFLLADQFVAAPMLRWAMVGMSFIMILIPIVHRWFVTRRKLTLHKALEIMNVCGLDAKIRGDEIIWRAGGQINVLRMNGALIQLSREFELNGVEENARSMEKAAAETMREVSLAKVIVTRPSPTSIGLSFLTEAFCSSSKSFSELLQAYIQVLDVAEERQRIHLKEVKPERKRIGFTV